MRGNYGFGVNLHKPGALKGKGGASPETIFGRVVDVILDDKHPKYKEYGSSLSLNGVFFVPLAGSQTEELSTSIYFAYKGTSLLSIIPLKNEIVKVEYLPSPEGRDSNASVKRAYWVSVIPLWNHPHHNAYPDTIQFPSQTSNIDLGDYFQESPKVNPLKTFAGDTIILGRASQSIRFTSTKSSGNNNPWVDSSNNGSPLTIISNGQTDSKEGDSPIIEDINKDPSSIYLTSNHIIKLSQANPKRSAWKSAPEKADVYKGSQVILNANRLYFNAREESAFISAKKGIGLNAKSVSIDGEDYIGLDATKIYLGVNALKREAEPVLLGQTSIDWMNMLVQQLETLVTTMSTPAPPPAYVAACVATANTVKPSLPILKQRLKLLLSKKVFTE